MNELTEPAALLRALRPMMPLIAKLLLLRGVQMSPGSGKQDLRTELTVAIIRSFMNGKPTPVGRQQKASLRDPGVKGPMWVSKVVLPPPEDDARDAVVRAVEELNTGEETFDVPDVRAVEAEWTGYRKAVTDKTTPQPDVSEEEKYKMLKKDAPANMVILYFHGGAHFLMDPCSHRVPVSHLSKFSGSPVLSVRYRLAPQNPFPAAIVDALVAYLSLIHPPAGSFHAPVAANRIVFAGDSAGANLCLALLQTLLTLRRLNRAVRFHGQDVHPELPGAVALSSPWCDLTMSMPSMTTNARFDYISPRGQSQGDMYIPPPVPADDIWPTDPPRVDMYTYADAILHPLACPLAAAKDLWDGAPPVFISVGEEGLTDEGLILARRLHQVGVPVVVEQFEGMPHCFGLIMPATRAGRRFFQGWAAFCRGAVAGELTPASSLSGKIKYVGLKVRTERQIPLDVAGLISDEEVADLLRKAARARVEGEKALREKPERAML